jgi:UDP-GlcNAc:undecaprenyl-phosphate GlcNAc-1-phosphate transferase
VVFAKAVAAGSVISMIIILFKFRFEGFSRAVFVVDAMMMLMLLAGSRMAFRLFRQLLPAGTASNGRRALIYGAGDAGELLLRELLNNRELQCKPVGFIDDDPKKRGKVIHGLPVFGGNGMLHRIITHQRIEQIVISSPSITDERINEILRECEAQNIELKRMAIRIESIGEQDLTTVPFATRNGDSHA